MSSRTPGLLLLALASACAGPAAEDFVWELPPGFEAPPLPEGETMSAAKVELGRRLFYDPRLSANETQSCASCHEQALGFTDGRAVSIGSTGQEGVRSAPGLANVGYFGRLTWENPLVATLEHQATLPLFGETPVELGMSGRERELMARLRADPDVAARFEDAFAGETDPITLGHVVRALASFERTLVSGDAPYDREARGEPAMSEAARRGQALFFSDRLECSGCHSGFAFTDAAQVDPPFHDNGLVDYGSAAFDPLSNDPLGGDPMASRGAFDVTRDPADLGAFRTPSLRNVALTAPYMHDGSLPTLDAVIDHYARGGVGSPREDPRIHGFALDADERADLIAFLQSLTDDAFVIDPRLSDPLAE